MATHETLTWDNVGEKLFETGVQKTVLYPISSAGAYDKGYAWSGVTAITESPSGAEPTALYADDQKYLNLLSNEEFGCTVEAYMYPDEFGACIGESELQTGVSIGQQAHKLFGLCYRTAIGNDVDANEHGYKLHLVYGCLAAPTERNHQTINDSPEAETFSFEISTTPVQVKGMKPTATVTIDSTKVDAAKLEAFEAIIYGSEAADARLPLPDEVKTLFAA